VKAFDSIHFSVLLAIAGFAVLLAYSVRNQLVPSRPVRYGLALVLAGNELFRYFHYGIQFPNNLPLHLCTISTWMAVIACLTMAPLAVEFAYFEGLAGATLALINPDLPGRVKADPVSYEAIRYFIEHGGIVIAVSALIFGRMVTLRPGALLRGHNMWFVYGFFLLGFNWLFGTNYLYLSRKPLHPSLLDYMGPWPLYLVAGELAAMGLFWLLWLPVRPRAASAEAIHSYSWRSTSRGLR
jgi:hypothetical integral membrane protein (TIGR02206 family)